MMKKSPYAHAVAVSLALLIPFPADVCAAPQAAGQRAGEVSRVIPAVSIARSGKTIAASAKTTVDWQDLVNTQVNARARIALDDGSVLNVGSASSMKIVKHDAGAQQTELELTYGKLRTQAQKIAKPDGKFEARTPAGVAGVVGTDFFVAFDNATGTMDERHHVRGIGKSLQPGRRLRACQSRADDQPEKRGQLRAAAAAASHARSAGGFRQGYGSGSAVRSGWRRSAPWCLGNRWNRCRSDWSWLGCWVDA
jgi:hypothetical protein